MFKYFISIFLLSIDFLINKKTISYIAIILVGSLFHSTAYFLLPLVFLPYLKYQSRLKYIFILFIFAGLFFFINDITKQTQHFISFYLENVYSGYIDQDLEKDGIGIGFFLNVFVYILLFYYLQNQTSNWQSVITNLVVVSFLIIPLSFSNIFFSRLNFYLTPLLMVAFPLAFDNIKNKKLRYGFIFFIAIFTSYQFFYFFISNTWVEKFYQYKKFIQIFR